VVYATYRQNPLKQFEAELFETKSKSLTVESCSEGGQNLRFSMNDDFVEYKNMDFGNGVVQFNARVTSDPAANPGFHAEIRLDSIGGPLAGTLLFGDTGGNEPYQTLSCMINNAQGVHDLFLVLKSNGSGSFRLNWFSFLNSTSASADFNYGFYLYPNPATSNFTLDYLLPCASVVSLEIYTISGLKLKSLPGMVQPEGINRLTLNVDDIGMKPGMYVMKFNDGTRSKSMKLSVIPRQ
jgi:hypothetical protein